MRLIALLLLALSLAVPAHADDTGLVLHYAFDETAGTVAHDSSGRGHDGTYMGAPGLGSGAVTLGGGSHVTIPGGILDGLDSVTVDAQVKWTGTSRNQWIFGLGPDNQKYLFASPYNGSSTLYSGITTGSWQAESKLASSSGLPAGVWKHVTVTIDSAAKTGAMYLDGVAVARATNVTVKPSDISSTPISGYIGKSLYAADPAFSGEIGDFRVYDRALTAEEVAVLAGNTTAVTEVTLPELKVEPIVNGDSIVLPVREGTDLTALAPEFELATGATISPASGTARDLSSPVTYAVTGADGATRTVTVRALVMRSPVIPGLYADPNIVVFGDRFYIYPTTDGFAGWSGTQFKAFSSTDLVHWQDHGVILDLGPDISWADDRAWAPTIAEKNGKYYFYFSAGTNIGVAVADSPTGPFTDPLGKPLIAAGQFSGQMIDPMVFTDDDGKSYLYFGNGNAYVVELNEDMISLDPEKVERITPSGYREASFVFKREGTYYFMWSENDTRDENYRGAYATGPSPLGPWTNRGVILSKDLPLGIKGPGHHSVVRVPRTDDWYIVYHRFAIPGGDGTHRETTVDRMTFGADGLIQPVVPTLESVAPVTIPAASTVTVKAKTTVKDKTDVKIKPRVTSTVPVTGMVTVTAVNGATRRTATGTVNGEGQAMVRLGRLEPGVYTVTAVYEGSRTVARSQSTSVSITVETK